MINLKKREKFIKMAKENIEKWQNIKKDAIKLNFNEEADQVDRILQVHLDVLKKLDIS